MIRSLVSLLFATGVLADRAKEKNPQPGPPQGPIPREYCSSENWDVTCFDDTGSITMDPKLPHEITIIFLHGSSSFATTNFPYFSEEKIAPLNARIVLP